MESNNSSSQSGILSQLSDSVNDNGVNPRKIGTDSTVGSYSDDDEGFVSGGEEFETASERPVTDEGTLGSGDDDVVAAPVFVKMPVAVVTEEDDDEKGEEVRVLGGGEVEGFGSVGNVIEPSLGVIGDETVEVFADCDGDKEGVVPILDAYVGSNGDGIGEEKIEGLESKVLKAGGEDEKGSEVVETDEVSVLDSEEVAINGGAVAAGSTFVENVTERDSRDDSSLGVIGDETVEVFAGSNGDKEGEVPKLDAYAGFKGDEVEAEKFEALESEVFGTSIESEKGGEVAESAVLKSEVSETAVESADSEPVEVESDNVSGKGDSVVRSLQVDVVEPGVVVVGGEREVTSEIPKMDSAVEKTEVEVLEQERSNADEEGGEEVSLEAGDSVVEPNQVDVAEMVDKEMELVNWSNQTSPNVEKPSSPGDVESSKELVNGSSQTSNAAEKANNVDDVDSETSGVTGSEPLNVKEQELDADFNTKWIAEGENENADDGADMEELASDEETDGMIFGSSTAAKQFIEELEREAASASVFNPENSQEIDGQIVTDSEEEDTDGEGGDGKEVFDSAAFAALLKAATGGGGGSDGGNITITSQDGSRLFSIERPAGLGSTIRSAQPIGRANRSALFAPPTVETEKELSEEEKKKLECLQKLRVKFLRLVRRLGASPEDSVAAQVLYRLTLVAGRPNNQAFSLDAAKRTALELEAEGKDDLEFSVNILVLGKCGVGKSSTINSIFGEEKAKIGAFEPGTTAVREITGVVDGVKIKVIDAPGLKSAVTEQGFNRKVLSSVKRFTKKSPPDIFLYVDRLDTQTRDLNDLPLLKTITGALGQAIWRSAIVTLTHGASAPPDGPSGNPLNYEVSVTQRSHVVQQLIGHAVGDLRMMSPSLMNPVSLVENHPMCRKNRDGQKVLPNGQTWRPQLLLLCYSMKILAEANSISKPQDPFDHRKLFGFRARSPPLPYLLSSMLQTRAHPKLPSDQGIDNGDSDVDLADFSDSDNEDEEDEYDQLPPFKPLRKAQIDKLSKEQRKAYFEEFDYRVKLLQKKQWREEVRRAKEMKKSKKAGIPEYGFAGEEADQETEGAAPVATPLPDMALPPSFDSDNPAYRYRFLEPTSQFLARPVLDTHGWDHDCGYDGVNLEHSLAIASKFPTAVSVQITKDKKDFSIHLDSSVAAKHGENGSTMAGFDIQNVGKQLAYIVRGETKFKNLKKNKTAAGISVTFLGENVAMGLKVEDQIAFGKQWAMVGSAGAVRSRGDAAYGANFELQRRELEYPIGQVQSTYGLSLIKWRGDWALGFNSVAQFSIGRNSKVALRAGINNKLSGQITVKTSSSDHLSLALVAFLPVASAVYKKIWPAAGDSYSIY